ncbi:hypothetical protein FPRO04_12452 [Fusarium proliferatum]|nr:hypothetical protein FPRO04_12452 [Fusarium proliferatum]
MVLLPITARPELSLQQSTAALDPSVPPTPPPSEAETSEPHHENEELERSQALKLLMLLSTIDRATSPNYVNPHQLYDEAARYDLPELNERYFERLFQRLKPNTRQPIPRGIVPAYEILGKALQSKGTRLEPLRLNMEVDDHFLSKELPNSEWALSAVKHGKLLADHGCYYDIMLDESPYIKIYVKLSCLIDKLDKLKVQTVRTTAEYLPTHRLQLQQLRSMPRSEDCFDKPIKNLSALFEDIGGSNNTYNRQINSLRLHLCRGLSFDLDITLDGFGLLDEVDDKHPPSEFPSNSSMMTRRLKFLEQRVQRDLEKLDDEVTQSMHILQSRLKDNDVANWPQLSIHIHRAQILQSQRRQYLSHATSILYHQQMLKRGETSSAHHRKMLKGAIEDCDQFLLVPEEVDGYVMV